MMLSRRTKVASVILAALVSVGIAVPVFAASTVTYTNVRKWCTKIGNGEVHELWALSDGSCQTGYVPSTVIGALRDCPTGFAVQVVTVVNGAKTASVAADLKDAQDALALRTAETAIAQAALSTELAKATPSAATVVTLQAAVKTAVTAQAAAQKKVDVLTVEAAKPATYDLSVCVRS